MGTEVRNVPEKSRYEILLDGRIAGIADYADRGDVLVFHHTEIDASLRSHGLGAATRGRRGSTMSGPGASTSSPTCWYVAEFVECFRLRDLLAAARITSRRDPDSPTRS